MQNIGLVVEKPAHPMAYEVAHNAHALLFGIGLDGRADVAGRVAGSGGGDARSRLALGHFDQPLGLARNFDDRIHPARVPVPAVDDQRQVDVENVALAQRPLVGMPWQTTWLSEVQRACR